MNCPRCNQAMTLFISKRSGEPYYTCDSCDYSQIEKVEQVVPVRSTFQALVRWMAFITIMTLVMMMVRLMRTPEISVPEPEEQSKLQTMEQESTPPTVPPKKKVVSSKTEHEHGKEKYKPRTPPPSMTHPKAKLVNRPTTDLLAQSGFGD